MPVIKNIRENIQLAQCVRYTIEECGIGVQIGESLRDGDELIHEIIAILKPDAYYNSRDFRNPPKAADNVAIIKDHENFDIYVIELKSAKKPRNIKIKDIKEKFEGVLNCFFCEFKDIFKSDYNLRKINLWLVCNPFNYQGDITDEIFRKKIKGTALEFFQSMKPMEFKGKAALIIPMLPPPVIEKNDVNDPRKT
ncbi:hypothetical protein [Zymobacter sp. IVIA_5232.4 C2]|uniref:hypothetical protein n=1 Tax=Zymobacter sp. IVIA_5232.4 C2 TaxID=3394855 RepID=UPI0039C2BC11